MHVHQALLRCCLLVGAPLLAGEFCEAQVRRYQPRQSTVSPYLNLTRFNNGAIPNYYAFVRPQLQQQAINRQEQVLRQQQAGQIQQLRNQVQQGLQPASPTGKGSWFLVPGRRNTFLDSSRYYQTPGVRR